MKAAFLVGRRVYLRGVERSDLPALVEWKNDHEVTKLLFTGARPSNLELIEEEWRRDERDQNTIPLAVCLRAEDRFVGTTGLYEINWIMRTAAFRVLIGDRSAWQGGVGTECTKLMAYYGFEKLNLNRIWLGVNAHNVGGVRAYEKAGFVREGILRQEQYRNFQYYDVIRMSMLREEYGRIRDGYLDRDRES